MHVQAVKCQPWAGWDVPACFLVSPASRLVAVGGNLLAQTWPSFPPTFNPFKALQIQLRCFMFQTPLDLVVMSMLHR